MSLFCLLTIALLLIQASRSNAEYYYDKPAYYQFGYQVKDDYYGPYLGHMERSSGPLTVGEFKVQLPDGRVQVVSYEADDYGYRPTVTYLYPEEVNKKKIAKLDPKYYLLSMMKNGVPTKYVVLNKSHSNHKR